MYAIGYDDRNHVLIAGNQDNGNIAQSSKDSLQWNENEWKENTSDFGDGGDQGVDNSDPGRVFRYSVLDGTVRRRTYDLKNTEIKADRFDFPGDFFALNKTDPKRLLIVAKNHLFESPDRGVTRTDITSQLPTLNSIDGLAYSSDIAYVRRPRPERYLLPFSSGRPRTASSRG